MQPIIFDHVNHIVVQVGADKASQEKYAELVAAQRPQADDSGQPGE